MLSWQDRARFWVHEHGDKLSAEVAVRFFERAIENTRCVEQAWFGLHQQTMSIVVGGIYLAAIDCAGRGQVWLEVYPQSDLPVIRGVEYFDIKSTKRLTPPLLWAHATLLDIVESFTSNDALWRLYSLASQSIIDTPSAHPRDAVQLRRGNVPVSTLLSGYFSRNSQSPARGLDTTLGPTATTHARARPSFVRSEVFPVIARLIVKGSADSMGFVSHDVIVSEVLGDAEAAVIVARARTVSSWPDDRTAASNMVAWFSQQITVGRSAWTEFFDRERRGSVWAYRPKTSVSGPFGADIDLSVMEGEPRMFFHVRRERDSRLVKAKRQAVRATHRSLFCEACGLVDQTKYPVLTGDVYEIHHRRPLAEAVSSVETSLGDLAVLCANCHRAIHRTKPFMSVDDFRARFFSGVQSSQPAQRYHTPRAE